jgi:hypothetical protein
MRMATDICVDLKGNKKYRHWEDLVGYTLEELEIHLKSTMSPEMTWQQYLDGKLWIDHILPRELFEYETAENPQFKYCWSLQNLRLLLKRDNILKNDILPNGKKARYLSVEQKRDYLISIGLGYLFDVIAPNTNGQNLSTNVPPLVLSASNLNEEAPIRIFAEV